MLYFETRQHQLLQRPCEAEDDEQTQSSICYHVVGKCFPLSLQRIYQSKSYTPLLPTCLILQRLPHRQLVPCTFDVD